MGHWSNDTAMPALEPVPAPPPQTPVERIVEIVERFFLEDSRLTTELLQELAKCSASDLVRLIGCADAHPQAVERLSAEGAPGVHSEEKSIQRAPGTAIAVPWVQQKLDTSEPVWDERG
jgi:hypothetical protein